MKQMIALPDLARLLVLTPSNLRAKLKKDKVATTLAPTLTPAGVRIVRWVPACYAESLAKFYEEAKANMKGI